MTPERSSPTNRILNSLPPGMMEAMQPFLTLVNLGKGHVLIGPQQPIEHAFFIETGTIALITRSEDGTGGIAASLVGSEGVVGCPALTEMWTDAFSSARVQQAGTAWRIDADLLRGMVDGSPVLRAACLRHILALMSQIVQTMTHSARHTLPERCARWLLDADHRAGGGELHVTHDKLAGMLGVRRAGVTVALTEMQLSGLIRGDRGRVTVLDRAGLRELAGTSSLPIEIRPERARGARGRMGKLGVFAVRLREIRREHGRSIGRPALSSHDFAEELDVSPALYERLEAAQERPRLSFLVALHRRTGIRIGGFERSLAPLSR